MEGSNGNDCDNVPCFVSHSSTMQGMLRPLVSIGLAYFRRGLRKNLNGLRKIG